MKKRVLPLFCRFAKLQNAINFLREYDGIDFMESVELAASVGMEVPKQESQ